MSVSRAQKRQHKKKENNIMTGNTIDSLLDVCGEIQKTKDQISLLEARLDELEHKKFDIEANLSGRNEENEN